MIRSIAAAVCALLASVGLSACSSARDPGTYAVPGDYATVQDAVDDAVPGDLILISPGTYAEEITVDVDDVTVRGLDRNEVIFDGGDDLRSAFIVTGDGVSIENMTVHSYRHNGVIFTGTGELGHFEDDYRDPPETEDDGTVPHLERFHVSYVTSYNNGLYGVYAFQSRNGVIDNVYASGHPDSGLYVGQCDPCNTVIDAVTMEDNAIGYYGTNASGKVYVVNSTFRGNRLGLTPNSQTQELLSPQRETFVVGNVIEDNDNANTPPITRGFFGGGIAIGGGVANYVARNLVTGHDVFGIGVVGFNPFDPEGNVVEGNVLRDNGTDLIYGPSSAVSTSAGNCFQGNDFTTSLPEDIETLMPCDEQDHPLDEVDLRYPRDPAGVDYRTMDAPPAQTTMPGDLTVAPAPLPTEPTFPDLDAITVPSA
ncbi:right-handed parallel beta-helix repeat-containing protein [Demequina aurantiaca]|uniref:right-handed parallel beta-helix repeat-containing protein n=1 Tax=Demequina aurantiaca TaxID=676200 RepID=UPI000781A7EF|nr:right-handed parallel beta-helix repeat-containing protein [Demequina aurantiaca]